MDFQHFLKEIKKLGYGVGCFNTYDLKGINHFYIMINQKGERGQFFKCESKIENLNVELSKIFIEIARSRL